MVTIKKMNFEVDTFIESLSLPHNVARGVLQKEEDCKEFELFFYGKNRNAIDDLLDYKEHKVESATTTSESFVELCYEKGLKEAFEATFFQSFTSMDMTVVAGAIANSRISLSEIYEKFQNNPNKNIMRYVL